ncbi:multidrug resistance efflux transporter family protein [Luteimonas sp. Y-2-2-4F]|nr:multidrug resistance efflux transporter family protein [Luteimonas sp. Y-2-2-4F]MCD9032457.1 multidrug resistance efflux transporter family protein [Luteimonas sp. Y-2-2-4F]
MSAPPRNGRLALAAVGIALLSALFFTMTYVLNRASASEGGHWAWMASLRYLITLPLLLPLMRFQGGARPVLRAIAAHPWAWLRCAGIGFVLFYCMLSYAAASGPSWLVAGSFQFTVIAGMLCAPLLYRDARRRVPPAGLAVAATILAGVLLMQFGHAQAQQAGGGLGRAGWIALGCVLVAAVSYPLGNRLLLLHLERSGEPLNATQRVFGLTLASQPLWLLVALYAGATAGAPAMAHVWLAAGVALFAGVIATILFFQATGMVRDQPLALGAAEAMQGAEVVFAVALGVLLLGEAWPTGRALAGAGVVIAGIVAFAWVVARPAAGSETKTRALRTDKGA